MPVWLESIYLNIAHHILIAALDTIPEICSRLASCWIIEVELSH
jgi:hypothetical protein